MKWKTIMHTITIFFGSILGVSVYVFMNINRENHPTEIILTGLLGIVIAYLTYMLSRLLDSHLGWKENTGARLLIGIVINTILAVSLVLFGLKMYGQIDFGDIVMKISILLFAISLIFNIIYFIFYSYYSYTKGQVLEKTAERMQKEVQLSTLRSQLSPHFLFNSLNALSSLFHKDSMQAEQFIRSLAKSFSYVLMRYDAPLVKLRDELVFVEAYVDMIKLRFGSNLRLLLTLDEKVLNSKVAPLTIQMLVENAVKHNNMDVENELQVEIKEVNGFLEISNRKNARASVRNSTQVGLRNISDRYGLLQVKKVKIEDGQYFKVSIPIIR